MAFKLKKKIDEILEMDFVSYSKFLKKEISRAAKLGELDAVICGNHQFSDGKESALVLMGKFTGELAQYFKKNKTTAGFARGKCLFEKTDKGIVMHISINGGKGKPDKIKKGGKKLWPKLGITPQFHKGDLPNLSSNLDQVNLGEENLQQEADVENDSRNIKLVLHKYVKARKALQAKVIPLISDKQTQDSAYNNQHFKIAKATLKSAASFRNKFQEVEETKQPNFQKEFDKIQQEYPKLKRIVAKVKQALMASNAVDIELSNDGSDNIQRSLEMLEKEFERLAELEVQAKEALKFLDSLIK